MAAFPALPLWTDAFLADTGHLDGRESGAYLLLLIIAWRRPDCDLPDDDDKLARWARVDRRTWKRMKPVVMDFWTLNDGLWTQKRLTAERAGVSKRADVSRANGMKGGRSNALKTNETANPVGSFQGTRKEPTQTHIKKERKELPSTEPRAPQKTDQKINGSGGGDCDLYSKDEIATLRVSYPTLDIPARLASLVPWAKRKWTAPAEQKAKVSSRLRREYETGKQAPDIANTESVTPSPELLANLKRKGLAH